MNNLMISIGALCSLTISVLIAVGFADGGWLGSLGWGLAAFYQAVVALAPN